MASNALQLFSIQVIGHPILEWWEANQQSRVQYKPMIENLWEAMFSCLEASWSGSYNEKALRDCTLVDLLGLSLVLFPFFTAGLKSKSKKIYNLTLNFWTNHYSQQAAKGTSGTYPRDEMEAIQLLISEGRSSISSPGAFGSSSIF